MDDKTLIEAYTKKSIAGLKEEHFQELWAPGDHMYRGEFVSPSRPEIYFANDAEVDAYRDALERMDGTIDAPAPVQPAYTQEPAQASAQPHPNPIIEALSNAGQQSGDSGYRVDEAPAYKEASRADFDRYDDNDDDDDDDYKRYDRDDDDDDDYDDNDDDD